MFQNELRDGLIVVISAPSGTGKGTIIKVLKEYNSNIRLSISATTRKPREGEADGESYFFSTVEDFKRMIDNGDLLEWVEYCDNYYGTPRKHIEDTIKLGFDVVLELEIEGALNVREKYPDSVLVFVAPPSFAELRKRIEGRGTEKPEVIKKRLERAKKEMEYIDRYDYIVINDDVGRAAREINSILASEKLRVKRNKDILKYLFA